MQQGIFIFFGTLSLLVLCAAAFAAWRAGRAREGGRRVFTPLHLFTFGVFLATLLVFLPIYYSGYDFGDRLAYLRPLLVSIHHAFRVFILDGEFDTIRDAAAALEMPHHVLFSLYAALLYVLAPVLTFGNVLSLFRNMRSELRFALCRRRELFIFSELNERSVTLAESVSSVRAKDRPVIVFTDVFERDEEDDYELKLRAQDLGAILLKKDVVRLNIRRKKKRVEFFLIGENESENVEQAIRLTEDWRGCGDKPVSIFIFSSKPSAGYVLDSLDKGEHTLDRSITGRICEDPKRFLQENTYYDATIDSGFYVRRVDSVELLVCRTLTAPEVVDALFRVPGKKTLSVMILGMGSYGTAFLRTALWLYQICGYNAEFNIFDRPAEGRPSAVRRLAQAWPEIVDDPGGTRFSRQTPGDGVYDIRFFDGTDCFTADFDRLFESAEYAQRLARTDLAIVALGDDDRNIEAAAMLRALFDRLGGVTNGNIRAGARPAPLIYSVVYDGRKANNLNCNRSGQGIVNYRGDSLQLEFIGDLPSQFSYEQISVQKAREIRALNYHLDWLRKEAAATDAGSASDVEKLREGLLSNTRAYMDYEYYRQSSISRALQEELLLSIRDFAEQDRAPGHEKGCTCERCTRRSMTEHMRWNTFLRTLGYRHGAVRGDRAKTHDLLVPWADLPERERFKDLDDD